jgi:hypothetical protein
LRNVVELQRLRRAGGQRLGCNRQGRESFRGDLRREPLPLPLPTAIDERHDVAFFVAQFPVWQLQELRDRKLIDFYETRAREVILYFRALPPSAVREIPLELMATVPGTFTAPASRAYLYYTDEHKHWVAPATVTVTP